MSEIDILCKQRSYSAGDYNSTAIVSKVHVAMGSVATMCWLTGGTAKANCKAAELWLARTLHSHSRLNDGVKEHAMIGAI